MKYLLCLISFVCFVTTGWSEEANGLRLTGQKTLLEKSKDRDAFYQWDKVDKALGIKVFARNISIKDFPEGTLDYVVIVKRWGHTPYVYESYSGSEKLGALLKGAETTLTVAKVPIRGYEIGGNRKQYQDSVEGWRLTVKHEGKETITITSTNSFDKLLARAKPGR